MELPTDGKAFVAHVRAWLEERARQTDASFPNEGVRIEKGEPIIRPLEKKPVEEQRKIIKFNHLVANCVILYNVFVMSKELQQLAQEGHAFDEQAIAALSPYIRHHINRFGHYQLNLAQPSPPLEYDLPVPTKKREEKPTERKTKATRKRKPKKKRKQTSVRHMPHETPLTTYL